MKFLVLSDLHLEYDALDVDIPPAAEGVILAGDIAQGAAGILWAQATFPELPVIYVPGNHEFYGHEVRDAFVAMYAAAEGSNVILLQNGATVINGIRFLGTTLWTDFALFAGDDETEVMWTKAAIRQGVPDYDGRIRCFADGYSVALTPDMTQRWHRQSVDWLTAELARPFAGKTVVVSHHAPSLQSAPACYAKHRLTPAYASNLDHLVMQADLWIHGHMHQQSDYRIGPTRIVCNPRGYEAESIYFDPALLLIL